MLRYLEKLLLLICISAITINASMADNFDISRGIEDYQNGNYKECISNMQTIIKSDPTSVIGYYYLAMAYAKIGKAELAIENYNKVINLGSDKTLSTLAKQGKSVLKIKNVNTKSSEPEENEDDYNPILNDISNGTEKNEKINNKVVDKENPTKYQCKTSNKESAKFEFDPNREPTNDEIVNAIKILQKAGLLQNGAAAITGGNNQNYYPSNNQMPQMDSKTQQMYSMMLMMNGGNNNNMMNMMPYMQNGGKVDPQMIKMMMMQQMMPNFSNGNNNGY